MSEIRGFKRWCVKESDLSDLNPAKARDLIVTCFYEAQKETFARSKEQLGVSSKDEDIHKSVVSGVKLAFTEAGENFDKPTKESLLKVVGVLARKAASWGTPGDIIEHHKVQIQKVIENLKG